MISPELKRYRKKEVTKAICAARKWACSHGVKAWFGFPLLDYTACQQRTGWASIINSTYEDFTQHLVWPQEG